MVLIDSNMDEISAKKKIDPGWNDPPMLSYGPSNPPPKSRISNKRVAYPLFTNSKEKTAVEAAPLANKENSLDRDSSETLTKCLNNFNKVLDDCDLEQKQVISKMLGNMKYMWEGHKITATGQKLIFDISRYLADKDISNAEQCYSALATENGLLQHGSWLIGIKHLIDKIKLM